MPFWIRTHTHTHKTCRTAQKKNVHIQCQRHPEGKPKLSSRFPIDYFNGQKQSIHSHRHTHHSLFCASLFLFCSSRFRSLSLYPLYLRPFYSTFRFGNDTCIGATTHSNPRINIYNILSFQILLSVTTF